MEEQLTVKIAISRWFPAVVCAPSRHAVLGIAGLTIVGSALGLAAPASSDSASAHLANVSSVTAQLPPEESEAPASAATPAAAPAAPYTSFEKALVPDFRLQPNYYYCGPAATRIAITAGGFAAPSMDDIAWMLGTTTNGTDSALDTTRVLNRVVGAGTYHTRSIPGNAANAAEMDQLRVDVVNAVSNGRAVVANIVGSTTDINGGQHSYGGGHYVSVVGYGKGGLTMKIADPADTIGDGTYWVATINLANWIATRGYSA
jgi:hypothetical protein